MAHVCRRYTRQYVIGCQNRSAEVVLGYLKIKTIPTVLVSVLKTGPASEPARLLVHCSTGQTDRTIGRTVLL